MGKSVRINVSLPEPLHRVYCEVAERTGVSLPQVLVNALAYQAAYSRKWMAMWNYQPRDTPSIDREANGDGASDAGGGVPTPAKPAKGNGSSRLSRQQRRRQEQLLRKLQR